LTNEEDFVKIASLNDIQPVQMKIFQFSGEEVCVVNIDGKYYAINNKCTHEGGPLADGKLEGYEVECPWHGSKFDVRTGEVTNPPASEPEPTYEVKVDGNNIFVRKRTQTTQQQQKPQFELTLLEKQNVEGTDVMSFKFTKTLLHYKAGQYAYFDIGEVYNDPKGAIRHFTIASSPTEDFILVSTRIRSSPYKKDSHHLNPVSRLKQEDQKENLFCMKTIQNLPYFFLEVLV